MTTRRAAAAGLIFAFVVAFALFLIGIAHKHGGFEATFYPSDAVIGMYRRAPDTAPGTYDTTDLATRIISVGMSEPKARENLENQGFDIVSDYPKSDHDPQHRADKYENFLQYDQQHGVVNQEIRVQIGVRGGVITFIEGHVVRH